MKSYTVHLPDPSRRDAAMLEKAEFVADGFAAGAFAFGGFWLLFNRLWVALCLYLVAFAIIIGVSYALRLDPGASLLLTALLNLFLGLEGNQLTRLKLESTGRPAVEIIAARNLAEAEARFFAAAAQKRPLAPGVAALSPARPASQPILGVFPQPGGRA